MEKVSQNQARLSGWVRLWLVYTALSWIIGGFDVALSDEPFRWPLPLSETAAQSIRHMLWFSGPVFVASIWITLGWIWRGFYPDPDLKAAPNMTPHQIARRSAGILWKVAVAVMALSFAVFWSGIAIWIHMTADVNSVLSEIYVLWHFVGSAWILKVAWEFIAESID